MARSTNGLVLYNGQSQGDFVELALVDGFVHYNFNLGGPSNKRCVVHRPNWCTILIMSFCVVASSLLGEWQAVNCHWESTNFPIRSNSRVSLGEWHRVVVTRKSKEGTLQINDE